MGSAIDREKRNSIVAMLRDRRGIDQRIMEIEAQIQMLMDERDLLKSKRLKNEEIAAIHWVSRTTVCNLDHGRFF
jgi:hypothetical protein